MTTVTPPTTKSVLPGAMHDAPAEMQAGAAAPGRPDTPALEHTLRPLRALLADERVTDLCINRPGECFVARDTEDGLGWQRESLPFADLDWCLRLARLAANASRQRVSEDAPLLSASLPGGERVQMVIPPACPIGTVSITIRRPAERHWDLDALVGKGLFARTQAVETTLFDTDTRLQRLLDSGDYAQFLRLAVRERRNILVSGPTGSGKTTLTKALIREIPAHERLITIEDAGELVLDGHPNHVRLFYSKDDQGLARVTPKRLLEASLRMKPDRVLLAELRGEEAFDYLRNVCSGHPGSITSIHAASCELAREQLALLVRENPAGRDLPREAVHGLLTRLVDVIVQFGFEEGRRRVQEIAFTPANRKGGNP